MSNENLIERLGQTWAFGESIGSFSSKDFEFSLYFDSKKVIINEKEKYLWKVKKNILKQVDNIFFNLPGYQKAISNICQLTIGKGILAKNKKTDEIEKKLAEFISIFLGGQFYFLWETCRLILTKGNCLISLIDFNEDENNPNYNFVNINPENFGVLNPSKNAIGKYIANEFVYLFGNTVTPDKTNLLDSGSTIHLKSKLSGILGVPPAIINSSFSNAVLKDILSFQQTKARGGFKKQIINFSSKDSLGNEVYLNPNSSDKDEKIAMSEIKKDINNAISNPNTHSVIVGRDFKIGEIIPAENNEDFKTFINEIYPLYIANLAGAAPYSLLPPKSVNRSTTEQQYAEMIQNTIQPLNNYLSEKIQKLYEIWCEKTGNSVILQLTLDNPKPELSIQKNVADILKAAQLGLIDINEARNELGLNPASDEQKIIWEKNMNKIITKEKPTNSENV